MMKGVESSSLPRRETNAGRWKPPGHMWKPICKTGLTGSRPPIPCQLKGRRCANSTAARRAILPFSFPNGGGEIFSESGMRTSVIMAFPKITARIFSILLVPPDCAAANWRRKSRSRFVKTQTEAISNIQTGGVWKNGSLYLPTIGARMAGKGMVYDKKVMLYVSRQLENNRISIIAGHYLNKWKTTVNGFKRSFLMIYICFPVSLSVNTAS